MADEAAHGAGESHEDLEHFRAHLKVYYMIGGMLLLLTGVTVGISYIHLPIGWAIAVGMAVALTKGGLVAAYFMHLIDDRKFISIGWTLIVTVVFFFFVLLIPLLSDIEYVRVG